MLKTACIYKKVFEKYEENESLYSINLADNVPDVFYWHYASKMVEFLQHFYDMTLRIFSSLYITTNLFFNELSDLHCLLSEWQQSSDASQLSMSLNMKSKFDKY